MMDRERTRRAVNWLREVKTMMIVFDQ